MYAIAGVTGHVGGHAAAELLARGEPVRVLVRSEEKGAPWAARGAEVAVVELGDRAGLAEAIRGCQGVFVLLPVTAAGSDFHADQRRLADAIAGAVQDAGVPHAVMLSSIGADLAEGTGPLLPLHYLENRLRETGAALSAVRSFHFQEKFEDLLGAVMQAGIYPSFGESADVPKPMIATRDVGAAVVEALLSPPAASEVIDLDGPQYTERQVAEALSAALGKPVQVVDVPRQGWVDALVDGGVPQDLAVVIAELYDAEERGLLQPKGDRVRVCRTELEETIRERFAVPG